ncbi:hypothetical protein V6N11_046020 [Hibiscus sabdariffa]|uniref:Uncharacterized protein n=1 Tax=Hibiscus sabdariffa TaxID=183260 RepID=A0ABR2Q2U6_9ROSI
MSQQQVSNGQAPEVVATSEATGAMPYGDRSERTPLSVDTTATYRVDTCTDYEVVNTEDATTICSNELPGCEAADTENVTTKCHLDKLPDSEGVNIGKLSAAVHSDTFMTETDKSVPGNNHSQPVTNESVSMSVSTNDVVDSTNKHAMVTRTDERREAQGGC